VSETPAEDEVEVAETLVRTPKPPSAKFGWCLTNQHELCTVNARNGLVCHCPCENHGTEREPDLGDGMSDSLREIAVRYLTR
jgi:hypothetical protein